MNVVSIGSLELFMVKGQLVASQRAYTFPFMKAHYREVRHFYCPTCGEVWGTRAIANAESPRHHFYSNLCKEHGGDQSMLNPYEWQHLDVLSPNVLAYLILSTDLEGLS